MEVKIVDFNFTKVRGTIARMVIQYGALCMKCDLVYHPKADKLWIRMPEYWLSQEKKVKFAWWPCKKTSDIFQLEILSLIYKELKTNQEGILKIRKSYVYMDKNQAENLKCKGKASGKEALQKNNLKKNRE